MLKVCALLKNRAQEIRDVARSTLAKILEDLGVRFLQYVLKELQTTLVRGYQVSTVRWGQPQVGRQGARPAGRRRVW